MSKLLTSSVVRVSDLGDFFCLDGPDEKIKGGIKDVSYHDGRNPRFASCSSFFKKRSGDVAVLLD